MTEVQSYYKGYKFGGKEVYNPFSIINFLKARELKPYWLNSLNNDKMFELLKDVSRLDMRELKQLLQKEVIEKTVDVYYRFEDLRNGKEIWYLLTTEGYLTPFEEITYDKYAIKIPNEELYLFFKEILEISN